jgi:predicted permease
MTKESPRWRRYLRFWGPDVAADVDDEFRFHLEERIEALVNAGLDARAAREEALRGFGDIERVKAACRELAEERESAMRRMEQLSVLKQDLTLAVRMLRLNAGLTAAVVLTLALGIGATTSIFSVVNAVLLRPLPYADPGRMVFLWETMGGGVGRASGGHYHDWTTDSQVLESASAGQPRSYNLTDIGEPQRIAGFQVTPGFFTVQYLPPAAGRYFRSDETSDTRVVVLSYGLWQSDFAGDASVVGRTITLNGEAHTVVGVTPAAFSLTEFDARLWTPLSLTPERQSNYGAHNLMVIGKLKPGVTMARAQAELERITEDIRARQPREMVDRGVLVEGYFDALVDGWRTQLWVLLSAVAFVLLIGCGNVTSLLLARASTRRKEIAIRGALGGSRARLTRQLVTESLTLALLGGAAGVLVAVLGIRFLVSMGPAGVPRLAEAGLQLDVLGFALGASILCGLLFGLAPALRATRLDLQTVLREGGRGTRASTRDRVRNLLVVTQIACALVLVISAALFLRSAQKLQQVPLGFDPDHVTMMRVALPADRYQDDRAVSAAFARIVEQVRALPGVEHAGASTRVPMWGASIDIGLRVDGRPVNPDRVDPGHVRLVTEDYLNAIGIPVKSGRQFTAADMSAGAPRAVLINETLARQLFAESNPIGERIAGWTSSDAPEWREIVGVVGDVRAFGQEQDTPPELYLPITQAPANAWNAFQRGMTMVARSRPGTNIASGVRQAVDRVDPLLPLFDVQSMRDVLSQATQTRRFNTLLLTLLGLTGLSLAAIGIYGVLAFFVSQRTHEISVRMALGATAGSIIRMVIRQAVTLAGLGVVLGGLLAFWATRTLTTMLFDLEATDPLASAGAAVVLFVVAMMAAFLPARRAARTQPLQSLI